MPATAIIYTEVTDLGQRIAESARGLAYSAFFTGIDAAAQLQESLLSVEKGFRDSPRLSFSSSFSSPSSSSRGLVPTDFFSRHIAVNNHPFRTTSRSGKDHVERDYQDFALTQPLESSWETLWAHKRVTDADADADADVHLSGAIPLYERSSRGEVIYQDDGSPTWKWRHEWKRINKHISRDSRKQQHSRSVDELELIEEEEEEEQYDLHSSTALSRLRLFKRHLISSTKPAAPPPPVENPIIQSWKQDWETHQHNRSCDWTIDRKSDNHPSSSSPKQDESPHEDQPEARYYFHCPRKDCHHRLLRQTENLTLDISPRACVHHGCGYISHTVESWLRHVISPHHHHHYHHHHHHHDDIY